MSGVDQQQTNTSAAVFFPIMIQHHDVMRVSASTSAADSQSTNMTP